MTLNLNLPKMEEQLSPRITVIGVGGAGGNAVNNMISSNLEGVEFLVANTDAQALAQSHCERQIQLGRNITQGLGAGSRPDVGRAAAEEALDDILSQLEGANMVFITAGLGGGTGTGAAPVIARAAREHGMLTVGVCTKPFHFEGVHRMRIAESGLTDLQQFVDTLIIIPNQNLFRVANEKTTFADAFKMADHVLYSGVRGVTDLMVMPGLINLDFADIRTVMTEMGKAMMGTGEAAGEGRSIEAAEAAISNPLLDEVSMRGARGVLINICGSEDLTLFEVDEAANRIREEVDPDANIIFGSTFDSTLEGTIRISVVATGIDTEAAAAPRPVTLSLVSDRAGELEVPAAPAAEGANMPTEARGEEAEVAAEVSGQPEPAAHDASAVGDDVGTDRAAEASSDDSGVGTAGGSSEAEPAPLRAHDLRSAFIAPPPVKPEAAPRAAESRREAEPFAAAAVANGSRDRGEQSGAATAALPQKRSRSLFARMTGAAAARAVSLAEQVTEPIMGHAEPQQEQTPPRPQVRREPVAAPLPAQPAAARQQEAAEPKAVAEPTASAESSRAPERPEPAPQAPAAPSAEVSQPRLSGLEPASRPTAAAAEEDLLDIPAFLRRQAN